MRNPWNPGDYLTYGLLGAFIGGVVLGLTFENDVAWIGYLILAISATLFQIGIIAKGVQVGNRASFEEEAS
ncbi:hypothetical protein [Aeromicrobium sp. 9AM]|uniref:hypothetical protein n=1 Tax=Aeromicrobium sp. 9AM TaxID=2653126 RepID=UPI0012F1C73F|nr:hypothetical protein [Aeromicrobium sp. 9AM]VXB44314.1 hypothetical protein AERO9AM_130003 [Aeromicrobium sp. 9AM]